MNQELNINSSYFDGYYKDIWRSIIPEALSDAEIDYLIKEGNLAVGNKVLDIMCGFGRHAIKLSKKGIQVTAVDNLREYIDELNSISLEDQLPIQCILSDVLDFQPSEIYDMVICMGNSICFFDNLESRGILNMVSNALKPGGKLIINSWTIAEIAFNGFQSKSWSRFGNLKYLTESKFELNPTRIETVTTIINEAGETEEKQAIDYIYSISEVQEMLMTAGMQMKEVYSIPGKKRFTLGDPRAYIVAEKMGA